MSTEPVKVIQVGAGGFGHSWRTAIAENNCEVVALADAKPEPLEEARAHYGLPEDRCFASSEAWDSVEADIIIDATPHAYHRGNAARAFVAGKDVLVVKPMAIAETDCYAMLRMAKEEGRKLAVAQQLRFHPLIMKLRELVQSRAIGQIGFVHLDWFRQIPKPDDPPLFCGRGWSQPFPMLVEGAIHLFDYLRWVTACEPITVWGQSFNLPWSIPAGYELDKAPQTCAYGEFEMSRPEGGSPLHVCFRSVATRLRQDSWLSHWDIEGDQGTLQVDKDTVYLNGEEAPAVWEDDAPISDLRIDRLNSSVLRRFLEWREGGPEPSFSGPNNMPSMGMVFGLLRSWQTGARVPIRNE